jgi:hypothetical protein
MIARSLAVAATLAVSPIACGRARRPRRLHRTQRSRRASRQPTASRSTTSPRGEVVESIESGKAKRRPI